MRAAAVVLSAMIVASCGGSSESDQTTAPPPSTTPAAFSLVSGGGQAVRIKSAVPAPVTFKVTNAAGTGLGNVAVTFAASGGTLASTTATTAADGTVAAPAWTMGADTGQVILTAHTGTLQATATLTARLPYWTVMVYMAADNSLAQFGAVNLAQMTAAGVNAEVQVVVQAEFNPEAFAQAGLTPANVDRPNYDTFRYVMDGSVTAPPNHVLIGPTTDIGNVNMTDPAVLHAFVQWAEQTAPAEHTVLVLWNHGGDATGLIEDATSAPYTLMTLSQLATGLTGFPKFDVLYFEMCLMGGYEPLRTVQPFATTAVASEDEEYVNGWNFQRLLQTLYANPTANAPTSATNLANAFDASYATLGLSETIAAYNLTAFGPVDAAVSQLGTALSATTAVSATGLASATDSVQRYGFGWVTDAVDLADSLRAHVADPAVTAAATAVRQAVTNPQFLLTSHYRTGTAFGQRDESRSHGLTLIMPGLGTDAMPSTGTASMASYAQEISGTPWSTFLQQYTAALTAQPYVDVGASPLTMFLVWDTAFVHRGWLEMLMYEPDGTLYSPVFGSLSPSGQFSADAQISQTYYEGWASNQIVEAGTYYYLAWLVSDSTNFQPYVDIQYRYGANTLTSLYTPTTYPRLSFQTSYFADPSPTWAKLSSGAYSDLKVVATWTTPAPAGALAALAPSTTAPPTLAITPQQRAALQSLATRLTHVTLPRGPALFDRIPGSGDAWGLRPPVLVGRPHP